MAMTVESFQRFESRKQTGKLYPWYAAHQVEAKRADFRRQTSSSSVPSPTSIVNSSSSNPTATPSDERVKSMNVDCNNFDNATTTTATEHKKSEVTKNFFLPNITDDDKLLAAATDEDAVLLRRDNSYHEIADLMDNVHEIKEYLRSIESIDYVEINEDVDLDQVPTLPPPPTPTSTKHPYLDKLHRLSQYKDMLVFDAREFIKSNVPRLPSKLFEHKINEKEIKTSSPSSPPVSPMTMKSDTFTTEDELDAVLLPTRRILVDGIEEEDIVAKFISFLGWMMFLVMRMLSLSVFAVFYPDVCGYICLAHYVLMLIALINETRFTEVKWQRSAFYLILAYIYIFNLMEFKVKFRNVRSWYGWYFVLVFVQNTAMTAAWYGFAEFLDTWWFEFMLLTIVQSGLLSLGCFVAYFLYLKPSDKMVELKT